MKIGIIGAMEVEVSSLIASMEDCIITEKAGMRFTEGTIGNVPVVVVKSGIGKVNAGICVQILCDCFHITHVINTGAAGSLDSRIDIGDIVISTDALYHDVDASIFGYKAGEIPQMGIREFPADSFLRERAAASCRVAAPDIHIFEGRIASGDQFIANDEKKAMIRDTFGAICTEMEGAAIAHAAYINHIPFVIIRAISDKADGSDFVAYDAFEAKAARDCAALTEKLIRDLS